MGTPLLRPLTNPATAEIFWNTSDEVKISAYCVNAGCKIGYIRLCMRPHLQPVFPCLAAFLSVCQDVSFVNILRNSQNSCLTMISFNRRTFRLSMADSISRMAFSMDTMMPCFVWTDEREPQKLDWRSTDWHFGLDIQMCFYVAYYAELGLSIRFSS